MRECSGNSVVSTGYVPLDIVSYGGKYWHAAGGTAGNVAAILGFMGWQSAVAADLGDDLAGREVRRDLMKANVSVDSIRLVTGRATSRLVHEIDAAGHRYRYQCPTCSRKLPVGRPLRKDRAEELVRTMRTPDVFVYDRLNSGTILLAEHFFSEGSLVVFEPSRPSNGELTRRALAAASIVKFASNRDSGLSGKDPGRHQILIVTDGPRGAHFRIGPTSWHRADGYAYPVVDAGGAGDWTTAGLLHALYQQKSLGAEDVGSALRWAQALAAVSCGSPGARGLARQQSADAVVRAARFLEQEGERPETIDQTRHSRTRRVPRSSCRTCLLESVESQQHVLDAG